MSELYLSQIARICIVRMDRDAWRFSWLCTRLDVRRPCVGSEYSVSVPVAEMVFAITECSTRRVEKICHAMPESSVAAHSTTLTVLSLIGAQWRCGHFSQHYTAQREAQRVRERERLMVWLIYNFPDIKKLVNEICCRQYFSFSTSFFAGCASSNIINCAGFAFHLQQFLFFFCCCCCCLHRLSHGLCSKMGSGVRRPSTAKVVGDSVMGEPEKKNYTI